MHIISRGICVLCIAGCTTTTPIHIADVIPKEAQTADWYVNEEQPHTFHKTLGTRGIVRVERDMAGRPLLYEVTWECHWLSRAKMYFLFEHRAKTGLFIACDGTIHNGVPTGTWPTYIGAPPAVLLKEANL